MFTTKNPKIEFIFKFKVKSSSSKNSKKLIFTPIDKPPQIKNEVVFT